MDTCSGVRFGLAMTALAVFVVAPLLADTVYYASAGGASFNIGPCNGTGVGGASTTVTGAAPVNTGLVDCVPGPGGSILASAVSNTGHAGVSVKLTGTPLGGPGYADASFSTDVIFSTIDPNAPQTPVSVALNLSIAGLLSVGGSVNATWVANANIASNQFGYSTGLDGVNTPNHLQNSMFFASGGEIATPATDTVLGTLTTPFVANILLNVPVFVKFELNLTGFGNPGSFDGEFLNSLDFPSGSDVFTLPAGYTANSSQALLQNNRFVGAAVATPEPSTRMTLSAFLVCLTLLARRLAMRKGREAGH